MDTDVRSLPDQWTDVGVDQNVSLSKFGSTDKEFSGSLRWRDPDDRGGDMCTAYVVGGHVVRSDTALPSSGDAVSVVKAKRAPNPALPFLTAVHQRGERKLHRYTKNLSIERVLDVLTGRPFSGYIELSENVISGNYYAVFHEGKPTCIGIRSAASSPDVGEPARELMLDEVGIYDLYQVAVDPVDLSRLSTYPSSISPVEPNSPSDNPETGDTVVFDTDDGSSDTVIFDPSEESLDDTNVFGGAGEDRGV